MRPWRTLARDRVHANPYWTYMRDEVELPDGSRGEYHYVDTPGSVMVVPRDEEGRFVFVRQYRYLNRRDSLEFPGGGVATGEASVAAARKELAEEAGLRSATLEAVGRFNPFNGVTNEICEIFLAEGLEPGALPPDRTEEFEIVRLDERGVRGRISSGEIWDGMTLAAWSVIAERMYRTPDSES